MTPRYLRFAQALALLGLGGCGGAAASAAPVAEPAPAPIAAVDGCNGCSCDSSSVNPPVCTNYDCCPEWMTAVEGPLPPPDLPA